VSKTYTRITLIGTINLTDVTLKEFNEHTQSYPSSKDKLRFHLVGRHEMGTSS
jgi:hypothetical protein